ncbi:MAG TPA: hypothetical protein PKV71_12505 [Calditrichia bacterium]|nr:hypothetical protein [Calditrichota bacterium]HQU73514.1 hypothetical protein [Calditrichia bacterium]HQV32696.1 hypothetical protein [Calditrichia bacterium]
MSQVVIVEKDSISANILTTLVDALGLEHQLHLSWNPSILKTKHEKVDILFMNIELPRINFDELIRYFGGNPTTNTPAQIPIIYLYHHRKSAFLETAETYPHAGKLYRPFTIEKAFDVLSEHIALDRIPSKEERLRKRLEEFEEFGKTTWDWLESLKQMTEE